jgi:hypothetical protein
MRAIIAYTTAAIAILACMQQQPSFAAESLKIEPSPGDISIKADKAEYKVDDPLTISVTTKKDCRLHILEVDPKGESKVAFPNKYVDDSMIKAGNTVQVPPEDAKWQLRLDVPGEEILIALCDDGGKLTSNAVLKVKVNE